MIHRKSLIVLGMLAALCVTLEAAAATRTGAMAVSATVISACMVSAPPLSFGNNAMPGAARNASTTVSTACNAAGTPVNIGFDQGGAADATIVSSKMSSPSGNLASHALYREAGRTAASGNSIGTVMETTGASPGLLAYGRILAARTLPVGAGADIVHVTLTY